MTLRNESQTPTPTPELKADDVYSRVNLTMPVYPTYEASAESDLKWSVKVETPVAVYHSHERVDGKAWNEGVGKNDGLFVTVTREMAQLGGVEIYGGLKAGIYRNSEGALNEDNEFQGQQSEFIGGVLGAETHITPNLRAHGQMELGGVTGYENDFNGHDPDKVTPAGALNAGLSYDFNENAAITASVSTLPARTAVKEMGEKYDNVADAYAVNLGMQFKF